MGCAARRNRTQRAEDAALSRDLTDEARHILESRGLTPDREDPALDVPTKFARVLLASAAVKRELAKRIRGGEGRS